MLSLEDEESKDLSLANSIQGTSEYKQSIEKNLRIERESDKR